MKQCMIFIDGPMGSGKTTVANIVHKKLKRTALVGLDKIKFFVSDFERTPEDNAIAGAVMLQMCKEYIRQGISILFEQSFRKKQHIQPYLDLATENHLEVVMYQLTAPREVLLERVRARPTPKEANSPVDEERIIRNLDNWETRDYDLGKIINTADRSPEDIAEEILVEMASKLS